MMALLTIWHWCFANGVPGNLAASAVTFGLAWLYSRPLIKKLHEIHHHVTKKDNHD